MSENMKLETFLVIISKWDNIIDILKEFSALYTVENNYLKNIYTSHMNTFYYLSLVIEAWFISTMDLFSTKKNKDKISFKHQNQIKNISKQTCFYQKCFHFSPTNKGGGSNQFENWVHREPSKVWPTKYTN